MSVDSRIKALGIVLPPAPKPVGSYVPAVRSGRLIFLSGMIPLQEGKISKAGRLGDELGIEEGKAAARLALLNALAVIKKEISSLDRVGRIVRLCGFVASAPGFVQQPAVLNGASDLLIELFEDRGYHARLAVGVSELPLNSPVEIELIVEIRES